MTLRADIKYKSNWQQGTLKGALALLIPPQAACANPGSSLAQRRNKWICALKVSMEKVKVFGPKGNPNAPSGPTKYTLVPYEEVIRKEEEAKAEAPSTSASSTDLRIPASEWTFADQNMAIGACRCMHHKRGTHL